MSFHKLPVTRIILPRRPLRPPNSKLQPPISRLFTQNTQLLLVSPATPRPQLPFLHPASGHAPQLQSRHQLRYQLARHLTTERKRWIFIEIATGLKWGVFFCAGVGLLAVAFFGVQQEYLERTYPTPSEWSFRTRVHYRAAISEENPDLRVKLMVDRAASGSAYRDVMHRLEDPSIDGKGLLPILQGEGDIYVEGIGKTGFDITSKSEPWRRGYFECIMGAARGAEALDGWVRDTTRRITFPPDVVIGPSNPRPKPVPFGAAAAPKEEDCLPAFELPETFYMKVLLSRGFSTSQRLQAALAYADWLDFKGLSSTAEEMYDWGVDIAAGALPLGVKNAVDTKTGIINAHADYISSNILTATTALATHHARDDNLVTALPIFLSVLRARRQLPLSPALTTPSPPPRLQEDNSLGWVSFRDFFSSIFATPSFPAAPPTGDETPLRSPVSICEEAGLMAHIGEVLFASASSSSKSQRSTPQGQGLGWTRDAVELAETTLDGIKGKSEEEEARKKCGDCLAVGMENWRAMVKRMMEVEGEGRGASGERGVEQEKKKSWLWGAKPVKTQMQDTGRWERELKMVETKLKEMKDLVAQEEEKAQLQGRGALATLLGV